MCWQGYGSVRTLLFPRCARKSTRVPGLGFCNGGLRTPTRWFPQPWERGYPNVEPPGTSDETGGGRARGREETDAETQEMAWTVYVRGECTRAGGSDSVIHALERRGSLVETQVGAKQASPEAAEDIQARAVLVPK